MRRHFLSVALVICLMLTACANPLANNPAPAPQEATPAATPQPTVVAPEPTRRPDSTPEPGAATSTAAKREYTTAGCKFEIPPDLQATCGYLTVPEDRSNPTGKTIRLHVAVFKSTGANPAPDPVIYLEGGPGGHASFFDGFRRFLEDRDFILFDQRGVGFSEPDLNCKELVDLAYDLLDQNLSADESNQRYAAAALQCRDRLARAGVNLAAYTSAASAADLNDLRITLGYDAWNLYGISYGTRLALTTVRDFPQGLRSVILDSTVPLQANETDLPANANRAFTTLFDGCSDNFACNTAFPNLKTTFINLTDRLNRQPVTVQLHNRASGERYDVLLNGDVVINALFFALYQSDVIPLLPKAIDDASRGSDYTVLARLALINAFIAEDISSGMYYSVNCSEEIPFSSRTEMVAADEPYPEQHNVFDLASYYDICAQWGAKKASRIENEPVRSTIPTLVLAGQYDPITPPAYGQLAAQTLSNSFYYEFPGLGHGVSIADQCPLDMTLSFLRDPAAAPDATCIDSMHGPAFLTR